MTRYFMLVCDDVPHDVVLLDVGRSPLELAKAYRALTGVGLRAAERPA
ncbi:ribosomal protein L7/L12 [Streptacidiphilus sp. MAP12-20]